MSFAGVNENGITPESEAGFGSERHAPTRIAATSNGTTRPELELLLIDPPVKAFESRLQTVYLEPYGGCHGAAAAPALR